MEYFFKQFFFVLFFVWGLSYSNIIVNDSIRIQGKILNEKKLISGSFCRFAFDKNEILKFEIKNGLFTFLLPSNIEPGVYRLHLSESKVIFFIDLIVDGKEKNIIFDINLYVFESIAVFKESIQNFKWHNYLNSTIKRIKRLDALFNYLSTFHDKSIDRLVVKTYNKERDKYYDSFNKFINNNKNNWCGLMVRNRPYYFSNLRKKPILRDFIRKNHFWDDVDSNNPSLINSPLYGDLIDIYLDKYYIHPIETYTDTQKDYNFKKAIDILIEKFSNNLLTKKFIFEYLLNYFNNLDMNEMVEYINKKQL